MGLRLFVVKERPDFWLARKSHPARSAVAVTRRAGAHAEEARQRLDGRGRPCAPDAGVRPAPVLPSASGPATAASTAGPNRRGVAPCLVGVEGRSPRQPNVGHWVCWLMTTIGAMSQCQFSLIVPPDSFP